MTGIIWFIMVISSAMCLPLNSDDKIQDYIQNPAVKKFREYISIDTSVQENIPQAIEFWKREALNLGLPLTVYRPAGKPIALITWPGIEPTLPSIMLNSHMDVVPVEKEEWTHAPFAAEMDVEGNIYGRGAQDDKDVAIQYLEAVRRLREQNVTLKRTVHITLMPDEETGGSEGMMAWRDTDEFKALNVGFVLDEGSTSTDGVFYASFQDKRPWQMKITVRGDSGHGSSLSGITAENKLYKLLVRIHEFRDEQLALKNSKHELDYGSYTSVNINVIQGGVVANVIPSQMFLIVDVRLATDVHPIEMEDLVHSWLLEAGNGTTIEYFRRVDQSVATPVDGCNPYWAAMQKVARTMNITIQPIVLGASSDMIYLRERGYQALGFAPKTAINRIHGSDEYLNAETFLKGIDVYFELLKELANVKTAV